MEPPEPSRSSDAGGGGASPAAAQHRPGGLIERVSGEARHVTEAAEQRYTGSSAEALWSRLSAMDFINRGMLVAATMLLCYLPFVIVVAALAGHSTVDGLTRRLGLNPRAAAEMGHLFASATATSAAVTGASLVFCVLGGIAMASAVQELYERAFGLDSRGMKDYVRRCAWLGILVGGSFLAGWASPGLRHSGGQALTFSVHFVGFTLFWWFTIWFLLAGRVTWRYLIPAAVATGIFWTGMEIVFSVIFSGQVTSNYQQYGPIGIVFALMSFFIAIGVVIILGAVVGIVWQERQLSFARAFKYLARRG